MNAFLERIDRAILVVLAAAVSGVAGAAGRNAAAGVTAGRAASRTTRGGAAGGRTAGRAAAARGTTAADAATTGRTGARAADFNGHGANQGVTAVVRLGVDHSGDTGGFAPTGIPADGTAFAAPAVLCRSSCGQRHFQMNGNGTIELRLEECDKARYNVFSFQALSHRKRGMKHVSNQKACVIYRFIGRYDIDADACICGCGRERNGAGSAAYPFNHKA